MTHTPEHATLLLLGQLVGWTALSIAIYLQWIAPGRCKPKYFWGFLLFAFGMIFAHLGFFDLPRYFVGWLPAVGYLMLFALNLYAYQWIKSRAGMPGIKASVEAAIKS